MIHGFYDLVCYEPDGWVAWRARVPNLWTTEGMNDLLNQYFGGTALSAVYMGLISSVSFSALSANDTAAQIVGNNTGTNAWAEACNGTYLPTYSQATRPAAALAAAASGARAPSAPSLFSITANGTVQGLFLISDNTVGGQSGKLISAAALGTPQAVVAGQTLAANYTVHL